MCLSPVSRSLSRRRSIPPWLTRFVESVAPAQAAVLHEREEQRPVIHDRACEEQSIRRNPLRQRRKVALGGVMSAVQVQLQTE